jgi:hypothetical protein
MEYLDQINWTKKTAESEKGLERLYEVARDLGIHWSDEGITEDLWNRILTRPTYQLLANRVEDYFEITLRFWVEPKRMLESTKVGWAPEIAILRAYVDVMTQPLD